MLDAFKVNNPDFDEVTGLHIAADVRDKLDDPKTLRSLRRFLIHRVQRTSRDKPQPRYLCPSGCGAVQTSSPIRVYALTEVMGVIAPPVEPPHCMADFGRFFDVQYISPNVIWL